MPIYEYECCGCGQHFEYLILPSSAPPECPSCGVKNLERTISMFAVSSESTSQANIKSARKKARSVQKDMQHEEHKHHHDHHD